MILAIEEWKNDNGDLTHLLNHDLDENSIVVDFGAYTGLWLSQMAERYDCNYYALEPILKYFKKLVENSSKRKNITCSNLGISTKNGTVPMGMVGEASSAFINNSESKNVSMVDLKTFFQQHDLEKIDLAQINIEGMEFELLKDWFANGLITKIDKFMIQFHVIESIDYLNERQHIQDMFLELGYEKVFDYSFVWECWRKK